MKYQIRLGTNSVDGTNIFNVYFGRDGQTYHYLSGFASEIDARAFVEREINRKPEVIVAEFDTCPSVSLADPLDPCDVGSPTDRV